MATVYHIIADCNPAEISSFFFTKGKHDNQCKVTHFPLRLVHTHNPLVVTHCPLHITHIQYPTWQRKRSVWLIVAVLIPPVFSSGFLVCTAPTFGVAVLLLTTLCRKGLRGCLLPRRCRPRGGLQGCRRKGTQDWRDQDDCHRLEEGVCCMLRSILRVVKKQETNRL